MIRRLVLVVTAFFTLSHSLTAKEGDPVAIQNWPNELVTIESHWGLRIAVRMGDSGTSPAPQTVSLAESVDHTLRRRPNEDKVSWIRTSELKEGATDTENGYAMQVRTIGQHAIVVNVDGVAIILGAATSTFDKAILPDQVDVVILSMKAASDLANQTLASACKSMNPRKLVITGTPDISQEMVTQFAGKIGADHQIQSIHHNTLAIASSEDSSHTTQLVVLATSSWSMPAELESLFAAMEASCRTSQQTFRKLSVEQLNFRPENGTHTPRWNAEHMMGRQLLFFSQIYHAIDPTIPVMDLNPKQMPPDYEFAHPDWTGAEEARQMQRVSLFCRRYAYLLEGLDVDQKAPNSRWPSLRALLKQMDRHYHEHTANTIKKFDLPGWPKSHGEDASGSSR